jgi:hypothetical protein
LTTIIPCAAWIVRSHTGTAGGGPVASKSLEFEKAWLDVYFMLEDQAFDYSRVMYLDEDIIVDGVRWAEVPF